MASDVDGDTSGDYGRLLAALCRGDRDDMVPSILFFFATQEYSLLNATKIMHRQEPPDAARARDLAARLYKVC